MEAIAPALPNVIQSKILPVSPSEITSLYSETSAENPADLVAQTEGEVEAIAPALPNVIQSKTSPVSSQEITSPQPETLREERENLTDKTGGEVEAIAPTSPNLIQAKTSPVLPPEITSPQVQTIGENPADLIAKTEGEVEAIAPTSPNLIQSKTSPILPEETVSPPSETSRENPADFAATTGGEVEAIAPTSPNLIPAKPSPVSSQEIISPQPETIRENKEDVTSTSPITQSEIPSDTITSSPTNLVQTRLEDPGLNLLKPLGTSKPLAQASDLVLSDFVADVADKPPSISQETSPSSSSLPPNISKFPEDLPSISRKTDTQHPQNPSKPVEDIPDSWSSISELIGESASDNTENIASLKPLGFSQPLNNANNLILPKLDGKSTNNGEQQNNIGFDPPTSWSNISELLGKSSTTTSDSIQTKEEIAHASSIEPESSSRSYTLSSPNLSDNSTSAPSGETSQQITASIPGKDTSIDDEQLEKLAQQVYTLMWQWLEIEQERQGSRCVGYPIWLSNITSIYGTSAKIKSAPKQSTPGQRTADDPGEVSPVDDKLQKLTREIYYLIQQRLEIERERQGGYYTNRFY
ncbi:MAG: hypothetical protein HC941_15490 [Microcoleus sp. SU_5_3]|nr:hypothetical protein [Microcoleus sp. SU_5_3]